MNNDDINLKNQNFSLGAIIIYGFGACESVNGILGIRLSKILKSNVELFSLYRQKERVSPHTLIRIKDNKKFYYIDIWGIQRDIKFTFEELLLKKNLNIKKYNESFYPNMKFSKDVFENGFVLKKFGIINYFNSLFAKTNIVNNIQLYKKTIYNNFKIFNISDNKLTEKKLIDIYIDARFKHISGGFKSAEKLYDLIISTNCDYDFCKISRILKNKSNKNYLMTL